MADQQRDLDSLSGVANSSTPKRFYQKRATRPRPRLPALPAQVQYQQLMHVTPPRATNTPRAPPSIRSSPLSEFNLSTTESVYGPGDTLPSRPVTRLDQLNFEETDNRDMNYHGSDAFAGSGYVCHVCLCVYVKPCVCVCVLCVCVYVIFVAHFHSTGING